MIEPARRHGAFDLRYPRHHCAAAAATTATAAAREEGDERLDWRAFSARYFRGHGRHDLEALAAFDGFRDRAREADGARNGRASSIAEIERSEAALVSRAVEAWEGEGGAATFELVEAGTIQGAELNFDVAGSTS